MSELAMTIEVDGVRDALATLRKVDPKLRTQATRELKAAGSSLLEAPRRNFPLAAPLSRWDRSGRLGYDPAKAKRGVQVRVGGRTPRGSNVAPIVTLVQANAGAAMFDIAGLRGGARGQGGARGEAFLRNLDAAHGKAQRGVWRAREEVWKAAGDALEEALEKVVRDANERLR